MRCLTANYLESHREYFEPFCQTSYEELIRNVLTMGKEADGLGVGPLQVVLKVKIDIVTIDRNYNEALQFEQMKVAGKFPQIYILYKPGHYDIIYSKEQSFVDGFDGLGEQYQERIRLPVNYDILKPGKPFFIEIEATGQESPLEEFKPFQIQYVVPYVSTAEAEKSQKLQQIEVINLKECNYCKQKQENIIKLECQHEICKGCIKVWIQKSTKDKFNSNRKDGKLKVICWLCTHILTEEEIKIVLEEDNCQNSMKEND